MSDEKQKPRWRGPKFEPEENDLLIDLAIEHKFIVQSKQTNKAPKQLKAKLLREIHENMDQNC